MGPNRTIIFPFDEFHLYEFEQMPKGELLRLGVNPYNGNVVMSYQDGGTNCEVCSKVLEQIGRDVRNVRIASGVDNGLEGFAALCDGLINRSDIEPYTIGLVNFENFRIGRMKAV